MYVYRDDIAQQREDARRHAASIAGDVDLVSVECVAVETGVIHRMNENPGPLDGKPQCRHYVVTRRRNSGGTIIAAAWPEPKPEDIGALHLN